MTGEEFQQLRRDWGLSTYELADLLRLKDNRTLRRWERGLPIPGNVTLLMELLDADPELRDALLNNEPITPK